MKLSASNDLSIRTWYVCNASNFIVLYWSTSTPRSFSFSTIASRLYDCFDGGVLAKQRFNDSSSSRKASITFSASTVVEAETVNVSGKTIFFPASRTFSTPDRKSVVSGKSVSVRVRPGGRLIIQKKNTELNN